MPALRLLIRDTIVNKLMVFPRQLEVPILDPQVCPCENAFVRPLSVGGRGWTNEWPQSFLLLLLLWLLQKPLHILDDEVRDSISSTTKNGLCVSVSCIDSFHSTTQSIIRNTGVRSADRCDERPHSIRHSIQPEESGFEPVVVYAPSS